MTDIPLCERVACNVINRELEFYENAHCMDGRPGIKPAGEYFRHGSFEFAPSELTLLLKHPVSNPLLGEYSRAASLLSTLQRAYAHNDSFTKRPYDASFWWYVCGTTFQWEILFVAMLTDPACPVQFRDMQSNMNFDAPSVWAVRDESPVTILFHSSTYLPIPSKQATELLAYINQRLRAAGIHLPRDFTIIHTPVSAKPEYYYELTMPKGDCDKPDNKNT